ncbi:hypothetical protein GRI38_07850 [Altererythrobacter aurantiacus]|uniref:Uncharacterized protein n=1 Tax=Parapontixanthobacter aurantiacus TaxID=1463599 RepID=A0A844ZDJ1_9SPHN|nr:hypothetical protein [Parapontixanthobacter aurantiacus]MXO85945.1 hypothetical protein [Parapontixanthobacter aurantiacus]
MRQDGDETHVSDVEASGGSKEGVVRWVLIIGTLVTIVLLSAVWIIGASTQGDIEEEATVSGVISSQEEDEATDSIILETDDRPGADDTATDNPIAEPVE